MLKRLAILGLLAAALPPMPGQTVKPAAQGGDKSQSQSQSNKAAPTPAPTLINKPIDSATTKPDRPPVAGEDKEHSVKLTGLPPITVTSQEKTVWDHILDWGPWVFNFGLVAVGILQIVLLKWTWKAIERQANIMDKGAKDAQESGAKATEIALATAQAAQNSADASMAQIQMMKDKERARLALILQPFNEIEIVDGSSDVELRIGNFGATNAFNVRSGIWCEITKSEQEPFDPYPDDPVGAIGIVRANADPEIIREYILSRIDNEIKADATGLFVHMAGRVEYEDVFGDSHFIRFQYIRRIPRLGDQMERGGSAIFPIVGLSGWKKCPHPDHNKEG